MKIINILSVYLKNIGSYPLLTFKEEQELGKQIKAGILDARDKLVNHNLRLVVNIAKNYQFSKLDIMDLIQEGNDGLIYAAEKFDYTKGLRFSTFATNWIKQRIQRYIDNYRRTIRYPVHIEDQIKKIRKAKKKLENTLNKISPIEDLSKETNLSISKINFIEQLPYSINLLDNSGNDNKSNYQELICDSNTLTPNEHTVIENRKNIILNILNKIDVKESLVLKYRFGFTGKEYTLNEIGKILNLSKERIRQIEQKALKKLKNEFSLEIKEYASI